MSVYNKYECDVRIVAEGLTNEVACGLEIKRIADMKEIGQAYCNFTNGGTGFSTGKSNPIHKRIASGEVSYFAERKFFGEENGFYGRKHTEETKKKISESRKGKGGRFGKGNPMYDKRRYGKDNPMFGRTGAKHHNAKMFEVDYLDGHTELLTSKQCENKFGIAFARIRKDGGVLHYKGISKNSKYGGVIVNLS